VARSVVLDKYLKQGVVYKTHDREAWIIQGVGTNSTSAGKLVIDNKPTGSIASVIAPLRTTGSNFLGPLYLNDFYYVVPPETEVYWEGASGSVCRVLGVKVILEPGEQLGEPYMTRFRRQNYEYVTFVEGVYDHGAGASWGPGVEREVLSLTPSTIERYVFDRVVMASVSGLSASLAENMFYLRFYVDNLPLENIYGDNIWGGVDVMSMPRPPSVTDNADAFSLEGFPIELAGDHTLSIRAVNVSGSALSPGTGASIVVTVTAVCKYLKQVA